ncbi:hypothetical protein HPP92_005049 [Vanilla planifolia]|uniref:Uncharacterized protein n=1 Tax=Vanilla planifolia TaxID=51239 RepID=A0A835RTB2_VANPL|nr:hypothetical protein HPP92_005049 [Vanilla planifolia]
MATPSSNLLVHQPPPYHSQLGLPQPYPQHQQRYPAHPPQLHPMAPPPPPVYTPSSQAWGNPSVPQHKIWEYPDMNTHYSSEQDWAAKARAWAAATPMTETHHTPSPFTPLGMMDEHGYSYRDHFAKAVGPAIDNHQPPLPQSNGRALYHEDETLTMETGHLTSPPKSYYQSSSIYEQEVPYSYSSSQGDRKSMDQRESSKDGIHSRFIVPGQLTSIAQPDNVYGNQPVKLSSETGEQTLDFQPRFTIDIDQNKHPFDLQPISTFDCDHSKNMSYGHVDTAAAEGKIDHAISTTPVHTWSSSTAPVVTFPPLPLGPSVNQFDPSFASQPSLPVYPTSIFGGISASSFQAPVSPVSAPFGLGIGTSLLSTTLNADTNGVFNVSERPKKATVPNWLREEIIKKKSAIANTNVVHSGEIEIEDSDISFKRIDQADSKIVETRRSTEGEEDEEDEVEAARSAAINQEIKRVLTEVLLKVTEELFDEIATKIVNEDEPIAEAIEGSYLGNRNLSPPQANAIPIASAKVLVPQRKEGDGLGDAAEHSISSSSGGNILGLANYGSDGDEESQEASPLSSIKLDSTSSHLEVADNSYKKATRDMGVVGMPLLNVEANDNLDKERKIVSPGSSERKMNGFYFEEASGERAAFAGGDKAEEFRLYDANGLKSSGTIIERGSNTESVHVGQNISAKCRDGKANVPSDADRKLERHQNNRNLVEDGKTSLHHSNNENNKNRGKLKENLSDQIGNRNVKQGPYEIESHSRSSSRSDGNKGSKKEIPKDKEEKSKNERKGEYKKDKNEDYKNEYKEVRSTRITRETFRHIGRSKSPVSRGRSAKDNPITDRGSSAEDSSDNLRKRKLQSRRSSTSISPTRSRKRQASRSPHSKHSHRRHSPYSSAARRGRRRSRSITPIERRRHPSKLES